MPGRERDIRLHVKTDADNRGLVKAANDLERLGRGVDAAGADFRDFTSDTKRLGVEIERTKSRIHDLQLQIARTGDEGLFGDLSKEERKLRRLTKVFKGLGDEAGENMGRGLTASLAETIGALPSQLKGTAIVAGVALGVAMAPFLGGVIASAVLGTVGGGGVIGGAILAAQDNRVQGAWKDLGKDVLAELTKASEGFREPLIDSAHEFGKAFRESGITDVLRESAQLVKPLTAGIAGFVRELGPGLKAAIEGSLPTFRVLATELPELGESIGKMLKSIARVGPEAALAMKDFFNIVEATTEALGPMLAELSQLYVLTRGLAPAILDNDAAMAILTRGALPALLDQLTGAGLQTKGLTIEQQRLTQSIGATSIVLSNSKSDWIGLADANTFLADEVKKANRAIDEQRGIAFKAEDAALAFQEGLDRLRQSVKDGNKSLSIYNDEGRENRRTLQGIVQAAYDARDAIIEQGGSTETARKKGDTQFNAMIAKAREVALKLHLPKDAVDALIRSLNKIPSTKAAKVQTPGLTAAIRGVGRLGDALHGLPRFKKIDVTVQTHYTGGKPLPQFQHGGRVTAGQPVIVGEKRPELFVPDRSGRIEPRLPTRTAARAGGNTYNINVTAGLADPRLVATQVIEAIQHYQKRNGTGWMTA